MWDDLPAAVASILSNQQTRVIVVKGAGDKAFISGADIAEFDVQRHDAASNRPFTSAVTAATASLIEADVPVIAMIDGFCIGGGVVIASACDIRICSEGSRFGVPAGKLGLGYELDNLARLQSIVGRGVAMEMLATARHFTAQEAMAAGFVNRVVPSIALDSTIREMADQIASTAPLSFAAAKLQPRRELLHEAQRAIDTCFDSDDFKKALLHIAAHPSLRQVRLHT
jgi:enoyl-CoA hydratase/carnithine racemase